MIRIPVNGFAGSAQASPAAQVMQTWGFGRALNGGRRRRKVARAAPIARARRKVSRVARKRGRMVKGSRAAKAYMARIRRRRGK